MCGIVGLWDRHHTVDRELLGKMIHSLSHRGPDSSGIYLDKKNYVGLGFRRLSIIDLSENGNQPMKDSSGKRWIVFNGEIFNYQEIQKQLIRKKFHFRSNSDSETVLNSYIDEGIQCLKKFHGMFAFAVWDENKREFIIVRDRIGIKPMYYYNSPSLFMFSSEIKALLQHPKIAREVDHDALDDYLTYGYVPNDKSIIKGIKKLPAGHYIIKNEKETHITKYWELKYEPEDKSENQCIEELQEEISRAVNLWTVSDVPVGVLLSGGIDSSTICSFLSQENRNRIQSFSVGFDDESRDETGYARKVASALGMGFFKEQVTVGDAKDALDFLPVVFDEPFLDTSSVPTYYLTKTASKTQKVVLSGDGGDELFFGYGRYPAYINKMDHLSSQFLSHIALFKINLFKRLPFFYRAASLEKKFTRDPQRFFFWLLCFFDRWEKKKIFNLDVPPDKEDLWLFNKFYNPRYPLVTALRSLDFHTYLVDDILVKIDRTSMANSLEARPPFLDHRLVEYVFSLPDHYLFKNNEKKYLLKKSLENRLPAEIIYRKKKGFGAPIIYWFQHGLDEVAMSKLENGFLVKDGILNFKALKNMIRYFAKKRWYKLWGVLLLEEWYKTWIHGGIDKKEPLV